MRKIFVIWLASMFLASVFAGIGQSVQVAGNPYFSLTYKIWW